MLRDSIFYSQSFLVNVPFHHFLVDITVQPMVYQIILLPSINNQIHMFNFSYIRIWVYACLLMKIDSFPQLVKASKVLMSEFPFHSPSWKWHWLVTRTSSFGTSFHIYSYQVVQHHNLCLPLHWPTEYKSVFKWTPCVSIILVWDIILTHLVLTNWFLQVKSQSKI